MTFDLDRDLEQILDAGPSGDHPVQIWCRSSHYPARRSDFRARTKVPVLRDLLTSSLTLSTPWMQARLETIVRKFGGDPTIFPREEAIFVPERKCPYHVTFDLDCDLEHILDAGPSRDHLVQVWWRSSHLSGRRSDLRKMFTDGQTDGRRTPHNRISSFLRMS